jgi:hypothetical protein
MAFVAMKIGHRPIFIATLRAALGWLFFRVAHSSRINSDMLVVSVSPARTALKNSQLTPPAARRKPCFLWDRTLSPHRRVPQPPEARDLCFD